MARMQIYRTYRWVDKDPMIDALRTIANDEGVNANMGHQLSGLASATISKWFGGETKRPQNATATAFSAALGYVRADKLRNDGTVEVAFAKARELDYRKEIEKQADWLIKQGVKKKPRKKKAKKNGHG